MPEKTLGGKSERPGAVDANSAELLCTQVNIQLVKNENQKRKKEANANNSSSPFEGVVRGHPNKWNFLQKGWR